MSITLLSCTAGSLILPSGALIFIDRANGGNLIVDPTTPIWDRTEFSPDRLAQWSFLVAAAAKAMLTTIPALKDGCINYWDAGNWALNSESEPKGPKTGPQNRKLHMHLLARSVDSKDPNWKWGEAPNFASFADRFAAVVNNQRLNQEECHAIAHETRHLLLGKYAFAEDQLTPLNTCKGCGYPTANTNSCEECSS